MKIKIVLASGLMAATAGLLGCGAPAATNNAAAKPANNTNVSSAANANSAANTNAASASNANSSATAGAQDFTLINKTGILIDKVFVSPHDVDDWEEDVLGQDQLADGASVDIKFHRSQTAAKWDLKVEDTKGNEVTWENLNLLEISKLTLKNDGGKPTAIPE